LRPYRLQTQIGLPFVFVEGGYAIEDRLTKVINYVLWAGFSRAGAGEYARDNVPKPLLQMSDLL
jgi:hypothetical protein